jgi:membrane fusion protein (multidrug efflux system)
MSGKSSALPKRSIGLVAVAVAVVLAASVLIYRHRASASEVQVHTADADTTTRNVSVYRVVRHDLSRSETLSAELHPYATTKLYAKVGGYLQTIAVDYGSRVTAGETIATLELPEEQAELERAQTTFNLAKLDYDRIRSVEKATPGLIAQVDVDKSRTAYLTAKDERDRAQTILGYTAIVAPFNGVVTKRYVDPGALIQDGTSSTNITPIVQVDDSYRLRLVVETPESVVPYIHVGTPVTVTITGSGETIAARVARYSYDVHENTRTMHTEVDLRNPDLRLKPGMYASVSIELQRHDGVLAIPTQALSTDGTPNVWVVDRANEIRERPVTVGLRTPDWIEVSKGLHEGDRVLIGDRTSLAIGMKVAPKLVASLQY